MKFRSLFKAILRAPGNLLIDSASHFSQRVGREVERAARRTRRAPAPGERDAAVHRNAGRPRTAGAEGEHEVHLDRLAADAEGDARGHLRAVERGTASLERIARDRERQRAIAVGELFSLTARALHD